MGYLKKYLALLIFIVFSFQFAHAGVPEESNISAILGILLLDTSAPSVTSQPVDQSVTEGQQAYFTATASGTAPLSYQWREDGAEIPGANAASYATPATSLSDNGKTYDCVITNPVGSATSNAATLSVEGTNTYFDDFITDTTGDYTVVDTQTLGGVGQFLYDANGQRLRILLGNNIGLMFYYTLPAPSDRGMMQLDFIPTRKYPQGGEFWLRLVQDADNYYEIFNTDGYGPGYASKVINGTVVEQISLQSEYSQDTLYSPIISFNAAGELSVDAFGDVVTLTQNTDQVVVKRFEIMLEQQNAFIDNIYYTGNTIPVAPSVTSQPVDQSVIEGAQAIFSVTSSGNKPLSYQWRVNGVDISGANAASYTTAATTLADDGKSYDCEVSNAAGSATSDAATLSVTAGTNTFFDDFSTDTTGDYTVVDTETAGGVGQFLYDPIGERLRILLGDEIGLMFYYTLPAPSDIGMLQLDFVPTKKYPEGGEFRLRLVQDADNYYEIFNTDGYGPGNVSKVINGTVVGQTPLQSEYSQDTLYSTTVLFNAGGELSIDAFGNLVTLSQNTDPILVNRFEIMLEQQDAYIDNIYYTGNTIPVAPSITAQPIDTSVIEGAPAIFTVTASGNKPLSYQWRENGVDITGANAASYTTPATTLADDGKTFNCVVTNAAGSDTSDVVTLSVTAGSNTFSDDFSTDTTGNYTVVNTQTEGGVGQFLHDANGQRLRILLGNNIGLMFYYTLPAPSDRGMMQLDFAPTTKYPEGGEFRLRLVQDADNYYEIFNTDGYGPGNASKVINGTVVEQTPLQSEYSQTIQYSLTISFSAGGQLLIDAFGDLVALTQNTDSILVNRFEIMLRQQDAYLDNIYFTGNTIPVAPGITAQPTDQTVTEGQQATFTVTASGSPPLSYQWFDEVGAISGATENSYTIEVTTQADHDGKTFYCVVTNAVDSVTSDTATLNVNP